MANEDTLVKTKKIKLKLTSSQKLMFNEWNDHHRYTYNTSIFRINTDINFPNKLELRNQLVAAENLKDKEWLLKTPKEIRARAVFEAHTRVVTGIKQIKNKTIKFFKMSFKDKKFQKQNGWCIDIPKQSIKKINNKTITIYKRITKDSHIQLVESLTYEIEHDCKIQFDGLDYFLIVPYKVAKSNKADRNRIISLDPGVRTFLSGVDMEKRIEIGDKANEKMYPLLKKLDRFIGRAKTATKKCKTKFKKRIKQLRKRIKNLQQELHKKTSSWLCKNYNNIIIPDFQSLEMSKKQGRKIKTKTVRQMSVLGHKMFLQRLKTKAIETNTNVIIVDEAYTSKTCACCENVKSGTFTSKVFKCDKCGVKMDRDTNGSINIFKKLFQR
jgi:putative transposase